MLFTCRFNDPKCVGSRTYKILGCKCGKGGGGDDPEPIKSQQQITEENLAAQRAGLRPAAEIQFDILKDPNIGLQAQTQLSEDVRRNVFSGESNVRDQLLQNIFGNLVSPTGISPEQQASIDARRGRATGDLQEALRTRANLGGGLFGGRSANTEERATSELQQAFAEEDINREERARLNAIQSALPALQVLFPNLQLQQPQFLNPVTSPNAALQADTSRFSSENSRAAAEAAADAQMKSAMFQAFGSSLAGLGGTTAAVA